MKVARSRRPDLLPAAATSSVGEQVRIIVPGATVPVLVTSEGPIGESQEILEWVDERTPTARRLFPQDQRSRAEVDRLCRRFDAVLGPRSRRLMYVHMLRDRPLVLRFNNAGVPAWEQRTIRYGWPLA